MSRLAVDQVGPATSVQDGGRFGAQRYGLPPSGAMDRLALAVANVLAGNAALAAAIEIGPFGASFTVREGALRIALAGATRTVTAAGRPLAMHTTALLAAGESVTLGAARDGMFSYLAFAGGIMGEPVFGSLSVNARAGLGSPFARPLQGGDMLALADAGPLADEQRLPPATATPEPIRVVLGPQDDEFGAARDLFLGSEWRVSAASDRMGYRLEGPAIAHAGGHDIVSDGTVTGSVQVPGDGQPIVLMPDRGTTGGYPKIATVISADLGRLAQCQPGRAFRFRAVSVADAQMAAREMAQRIAALAGRIEHTGAAMLDLAALHSANTAGVAVSATDAATWQSPAAPHDRGQP